MIEAKSPGYWALFAVAVVMAVWIMFDGTSAGRATAGLIGEVGDFGGEVLDFLDGAASDGSPVGASDLTRDGCDDPTDFECFTNNDNGMVPTSAAGDRFNEYFGDQIEPLFNRSPTNEVRS